MTAFARPELTRQEIDAILPLVQARLHELTRMMDNLDEAEAPESAKRQVRAQVAPQVELLEDVVLKLEIARKEVQLAEKAGR